MCTYLDRLTEIDAEKTKSIIKLLEKEEYKGFLFFAFEIFGEKYIHMDFEDAKGFWDLWLHHKNPTVGDLIQLSIMLDRYDIIDTIKNESQK